jgi:hypothetical protein
LQVMPILSVFHMWKVKINLALLKAGQNFSHKYTLLLLESLTFKLGQKENYTSTKANKKMYEKIKKIKKIFLLNKFRCLGPLQSFRRPGVAAAASARLGGVTLVVGHSGASD